MNKEEIKQQYTMRDIVGKYGFAVNRSGFIKCPFHLGDREASMKIYENDAHCYACGWDGDIFSFVQKMDNLTFKEAFQSLGGTYEKSTFSSNLAVYKAKKAKEMRDKNARREKSKILLNIQLIDICRSVLERSKPLSDSWCDAYNLLQKQLYKHGEMNGIPY